MKRRFDELELNPPVAPSPPASRRGRGEQGAGGAGVGKAVVAASVLALSAGEASAGKGVVPFTERLDWEAVYTGELSRNTTGGLRRGSRYLDNLDVTFEWDLRSGGTLFGYVLYNNGSSLSDDLVGDSQTVSNIDAPEALRLYELWYQQDLADGLDLRVGLYDLNSEFDVIEASRLFLNSSHGIGPDFSQTGQNGPSIFPVTSLAARLQWAPRRDWAVRAAVLDAVPGDPQDPARTTVRLGDGVLSVLELDAIAFGAARIGAGYWRYSERAPALGDDGAPAIDDGYYVLAEGSVSPLFGFERDVEAFLRYGAADARINPFERYLGAGIVVEGPLPDRPDDRLGVAVAHAVTGTPYRRAAQVTGAMAAKHETVLELTYRFDVSRWLTLQPDVQYVVNPGTDPSLDDALVLGLRFELAYSD